MKALSLAGQIILESGGETYRAEDTVLYMARALNLSETDAFGVPSGLFISYTDENGERVTNVCRIHPRGTHLARVDAVNQLSRKLASGQLAPEALLPALYQAEKLGRDISPWYAPAMAALSALGFAVIFGGGPVDMLVGAVCAAITQLTPLMFLKRRSGAMASALIGSMFCTLLPLLFHTLVGLGVRDAMVAAALMPLVPGLSMVIAMQDIMRGDMISGVANAARSVMIAAMMAGGTLIGLYLFGLLAKVCDFPPEAVQTPHTYSTALGAPVMLISAAFAGASFGALLFAPRKGIFWGGLIGGIGYLCYWLTQRLGQTEQAAIFFAALLAAALAQLAARKLKMIATVFMTIAMLPLIPGIGLYRAMSELAQIRVSSGMTEASNTMNLFLLMVLGISLGSALMAGKRGR